ncbi:unnamed protein product, partial [Effrenium voratum]
AQAHQEGGRSEGVELLGVLPSGGHSYVLMSKKKQVVTTKKAEAPHPVNGAGQAPGAPNKARAQQQRVLETVGKGDHKAYSPRTEGFVQQLTGVLDFYQYTPADIAALVRKCQYDQNQIQVAVANIIEDRANHEQEEWGTVKKKKQVKEEKKMKEAAAKTIEELQKEDTGSPGVKEVFERPPIPVARTSEEPDEWSTVKKKKQVKEEKKIKEEEERKFQEHMKEADKHKVTERRDPSPPASKEPTPKVSTPPGKAAMPKAMPQKMSLPPSQPAKGSGKNGKNGKHGAPTGKSSSPALKASPPPKTEEEKEGVLPQDPAILFASSKPSETEAPAKAPAAAPAIPAQAPQPVQPQPAQPQPAQPPAPEEKAEKPKKQNPWDSRLIIQAAQVSMAENEPTPAESALQTKAGRMTQRVVPKPEPAPKPAAKPEPSRKPPARDNRDSRDSNRKEGKGTRKGQEGDQKEEWKEEWWSQADSKWNGRWDWKSWNDWEGNADSDWRSNDWKKGGSWQWQKKTESQGWQKKDKGDKEAPGDTQEEPTSAASAG